MIAVSRVIAVSRWSLRILVLAALALAAPRSVAGGPLGAFLTADDVRDVVRRAAEAADATTMVVVVVDRMGQPLAVFRKPDAPPVVAGNFGAPVDTNELALALARTGAFLSSDQAPLSSRTVRFISGIHFPPGIRNKPNAALYGIENTNRGCAMNVTFNPGKTIVPPAALNLKGLPCNAFDASGCGLGLTTGKANVLDDDPQAVNPGGVPIFKDGELVGGIGVAGVEPAVAEFAAFTGSVSPDAQFGPRPASPGAIFLDGLRLPFVQQIAAPPGTNPGAFVGAFFGPIASPLGAAGVPDGWLVGPTDGSALSAAEVAQIVAQAVDEANRTRAAIRLPEGSRARMVMAVGDLDGTILGVFRMPDATMFSVDIAVTKARNVAYLSGFSRSPDELPGVPIGTAVTSRTVNFGAQPLYPPGIDGTAFGPFFQLFVNDLATPCRQGAQAPTANQSGIIFFAGSTPLYKGERLVGGLGLSGDGVEQDDLISAAGATNFAPPIWIRADQIILGGTRLPYFKFPRNPEAP